jgi:hypothetical protein
MLRGPRINKSVVTSSCGLPLTCRGEKICTALYNNIHQTVLMCGVFKNKKSLTWADGHQSKVETPLTLDPC